MRIWNHHVLMRPFTTLDLVASTWYNGQLEWGLVADHGENSVDRNIVLRPSCMLNRIKQPKGRPLNAKLEYQALDVGMFNLSSASQGVIKNTSSFWSLFHHDWYSTQVWFVNVTPCLSQTNLVLWSTKLQTISRIVKWNDITLREMHKKISKLHMDCWLLSLNKTARWTKYAKTWF